MSIAVLSHHKFSQNDRLELDELEDEMIFVSEEWAEDQGGMLEIATYTVFHRAGEEVFGYLREGGEERLHGKFSFGVGGHVEDYDLSETQNTIRAGAIRENKEEVGVEKPPTFQEVIYTDADPVSQDHLGVVFTCEVEGVGEGEIEGTFVPLEDLQEKDLEAWSDLLVEDLEELL